MTKVRTIRGHGNKLGERFRKAEGDEYDAPEGTARSLSAQGLVEIVSERAPLKGRTKAELIAIAQAEGVDVPGSSTKAEIAGAIETARAGS